MHTNCKFLLRAYIIHSNCGQWIRATSKLVDLLRSRYKQIKMYNIFCSSFALLYFALLAAVSQLLNDGLRHFLQLYPVIVHYFVDKLKTFRRGRASESMRYVLDGRKPQEIGGRRRWPLLAHAPPPPGALRCSTGPVFQATAA